jgi:hypothetical protein
LRGYLGRMHILARLILVDAVATLCIFGGNFDV